MIKNVVFDMGNVLVMYDPRRFIEKWVPDAADGELMMRNVFHSVEWIQMDRGSMTQAQATSAMCARLPERLHHLVTTLLDNWHDDIPDFTEMEDLCSKLKDAGYSIYLLSNTSKRFHEFRRHISALRHFDGEFISADWGMLKPDPLIYRTFCQHFGLTPAECFFIDDMAVNIEGAHRAGLQGVVYHGDIELLRQQLLEAEISL